MFGSSSAFALQCLSSFGIERVGEEVSCLEEGEDRQGVGGLQRSLHSQRRARVGGHHLPVEGEGNGEPRRHRDRDGGEARRVGRDTEDADDVAQRAAADVEADDAGQRRGAVHSGQEIEPAPASVRVDRVVERERALVQGGPGQHARVAGVDGQGDRVARAGAVGHHDAVVADRQTTGDVKLSVVRVCPLICGV